MGHNGNVVVQQEESLLDDIIARLLDVRNGRPGKQVQLTENDIRQLCMTAREIFQNQPNLLELEAPIKICGAFLRRQCFPGRVGLAVLGASEGTTLGAC